MIMKQEANAQPPTGDKDVDERTDIPEPVAEPAAEVPAVSSVDPDKARQLSLAAVHATFSERFAAILGRRK